MAKHPKRRAALQDSPQDWEARNMAMEAIKETPQFARAVRVAKKTIASGKKAVKAALKLTPKRRRK